MECLPTEINTKILISLPVKTLGQLKCVSKSFNMLLKSHHFIKRHSEQILDQNSLKLVLVAASSSVHTLTITDQNLVSRLAPVPLPPNDVNKFLHPTSLVGTCMGLACLRCPPNTYSLLNPTTKECRVLPNPGRFWTIRAGLRVRCQGSVTFHHWMISGWFVLPFIKIGLMYQ